ncbi:hypothetical protein E0H35_20860 [Rhizobium leguminosarum bv. viciae]|uniref:Uncharacterized protein n=2 Tax=Rhizobium TaxID=379 RepID=A0A8G2MS20_RHILV|nr:hypothetical protein [Rhizobium leguminosarum bv. viciae]TBF83182.1 hypothetical protein ELG86_14095 [Rhizobium leguminosarum]NKK19037.1 hypothetical protein [Rhizobium leguminosarum bv. viciae]NKK48321.1 hypothetical protein [Rhizobium leguminosarum bv. viciae]TBF99557.1 hypothetical protein ELG85_12855 [Rhizobium leguminosarum]
MKRRPDRAASDFFADMIKKSGAKRRILGIEKAFADNRRIIGRTEVLIFSFVPSLAQSGGRRAHPAGTARPKRL